MKVKVIVDDMRCTPSAVTPGHEDTYHFVRTRRDGRMVDLPFFKSGSVHEFPEAWVWVLHGFAIPEDEECREACGLTSEDLAAKQHAFRRLAAGIHPEDFDKYDSGMIAGYIHKPDGTTEYKPGPNWDKFHKPAAPDTEEDDED